MTLRDLGFELVHGALGDDLRTAMRCALDAGAVTPDGATPLAVFRAGLGRAIGAIENDKRKPLFERFLTDGPYWDEGDIPADKASEVLSDEETAIVIRYVTQHMRNCFQGFIAESLAAGALTDLLAGLRGERRVPGRTRLYLGDAALARGVGDAPRRKAADAHFVTRNSIMWAVQGVAEVKSFRPRPDRVARQLEAHVRRAKRGLALMDRSGRPDVAPECIRVLVVPAHWRLSRTIRFEQRGETRLLTQPDDVPTAASDQVEWTGKRDVRITLRWSREAIAQAAYEMTFWHMSRVGEHVFAGERNKWPEMTPEAAGRNAAKQAMYYAIIRARTRTEWQRAIALYNTYGFGYALGMNFRDQEGKRQMLWPEDLDQIAATGANKDGWTIR